MCNFNIKRQINKLYTLTTVSYFPDCGSIVGGASCTQRVFIVTDWSTGEYFPYRKQLF